MRSGIHAHGIRNSGHSCFDASKACHTAVGKRFETTSTLCARIMFGPHNDINNNNHNNDDDDNDNNIAVNALVQGP